jgi:hypothetical protein
LPEDARRFFESRFRARFDDVRIHTHDGAVDLARSLNAKAFTVGRDLFFGSSQYAPSTAAGKALLAHELAHVIQQGAAPNLQTHGLDPGRLSAAPAGVVQRQRYGADPCPTCHAPSGVQQVSVEALRSDDHHYLPDVVAIEFNGYLKKGFTWTEYQGCTQTRAEAIRVGWYGGDAAIVGYVIYFTNPEGSGFSRPTVIVDVYGDKIDEQWHDPQALESVMSPLDFIGPAVLGRLGVSAVRGGVSGVTRLVRGSRAMLGSATRRTVLAGRLYTSAAMRGLEEAAPAHIAGGAVATSSFTRAGGGLVRAQEARAISEWLAPSAGARVAPTIAQAERVAPALGETSAALPAQAPRALASPVTSTAGGAAAELSSRGYRPGPGERSVTGEQWKSFSRGVREQTKLERAFSESSPFAVSELREIGRMRQARQTVPVPEFASLQLTATQQSAASRLFGTAWDARVQQTWRACGNALARQRMAEVQRLWNLGTQASRQQARDLARATFDLWVGRFWRRVQRDPVLRQRFADAGLQVTPGRAPFYRWPDGYEEGVTIEHWGSRLTDDPTRAVDATNLMLSMHRENVRVLEAIRAAAP